jgi:hypothetical protein
MVSLTVSPCAFPAKSFPRLLGGRYMSLSCYSRGQGTRKSIVHIHEAGSPPVIQKPSQPSTL